MFVDENQSAMLRAHEQWLTALDHNLKLVMAHLGIPWQEPLAGGALPPDVQAYLAKGDKLGAIKALTQALGIGLAEAKAMVERGHR